MSRELRSNFLATGQTLTASVWAESSGTLVSSGISASEDGTTGFYYATMPAASAGRYRFQFFSGSTAVTGGGTIQWDGSIEVAQTGDAFARLGAPAGASTAADIATVKSTADTIKNRVETALPNIAPGSSGGLFIAGTNAATTVTTSFTTTFTGNLTGSVNSVANRVTANTDQLAGQTVSASAPVSFPPSVASPTNITAGTITTVTNLTNAPTAGDFTATMKASITTAATSATPTVLLTPGVGTGQILLSSGQITVGTNTDKTGYALSATQVFDNTGTWTGAFTALPTIPTGWITAVGIAASALDGKGDWNIGKTGYSLTQAFPTNFDVLGINASGHLSRVTLTDTVDAYTGNTPQTGDGYAVLSNATYGADKLARRTDLPTNFSTLTLTASQTVADATLSGVTTLNVTQWGGVNVTGMPMPTYVQPSGFLAADFANLDAAVSSRSTYAGADTAGTTTLLSRLTATRAGYLDNLSAGAAATQASVDALPSAADNATAVWAAVARTLTGAVTLTADYDAAKSAASQASVDAVAGDTVTALFAAEPSSLATDTTAEYALYRLVAVPGDPPVVVTPAPPAPGYATIYVNLKQLGVASLSGVPVTVEPIKPAGAGAWLIGSKVTGTTDADGYASVQVPAAIAPGTPYRVTCAALGLDNSIAVEDGDTFDLATLAVPPDLS